ncbi:hypothetical protein FOL47_001344 [Perkinsus chesapeaki]|uniref:Uncharacterized protein n=1 Tax=Perkinsus chesapeaki TaxID=330153 RepID=A0A7J6MJK7_PERCH|nr:hypothetical protein FOL47_001344 [Perkinsus chesapeaki]
MCQTSMIKGTLVKLNAYIDRIQQNAYDTAMLEFLLGDELMNKFVKCIDENGSIDFEKVGQETAADLCRQGGGGATILMMKTAEDIENMEDLKCFSNACIVFEKLLTEATDRQGGPALRLIHANQHLCALVHGSANHAADAILFAKSYLEALRALPSMARVRVKLVVHTASEKSTGAGDPLIIGVVGESMPRLFVVSSALRLAQFILDEVPMANVQRDSCVLVTDACVNALAEEHLSQCTLVEHAEVRKMGDFQNNTRTGEPVHVFAMARSTMSEPSTSRYSSVQQQHMMAQSTLGEHDEEIRNLRAQVKELTENYNEKMARAEEAARAPALAGAPPPATWCTADGEAQLLRLFEKQTVTKSQSSGSRTDLREARFPLLAMTSILAETDRAEGESRSKQEEDSSSDGGIGQESGSPTGRRDRWERERLEQDEQECTKLRCVAVALSTYRMQASTESSEKRDDEKYSNTRATSPSIEGDQSYELLRLAAARRENEFLQRNLQDALDEKASWEDLARRMAEDSPSAVRDRTSTAIVETLTRIEETEADIQLLRYKLLKMQDGYDIPDDSDI